MSSFWKYFYALFSYSVLGSLLTKRQTLLGSLLLFFIIILFASFHVWSVYNFQGSELNWGFNSKCFSCLEIEPGTASHRLITYYHHIQNQSSGGEYTGHISPVYHIHLPSTQVHTPTLEQNLQPTPT